MKKRGPLKASVEMFKEAAEVGDRLRHMREQVGLSQSVAAAELGISRERLANYEDGRTPLKVEIGLLACRQFIYSEKWLATGEGDPRKLLVLSDYPVVKNVKPGSFYGTAFREILAAEYDDLASRQFYNLPLPGFGTDPARDARLLGEFVYEWYSLLDDDSGHRMELMLELVWFGMEFCAKKIPASRLADPDFLALSDSRESVSFVGEKIRKAHERAVLRRLRKAGLLQKKTPVGE